MNAAERNDAAVVRQIVVKALQQAPTSFAASDDDWNALAEAALGVLDVEPWHAINAALSLAWFGRPVTFSYTAGRDPELLVRLDGSDPFRGPSALRHLIQAAEYLSAPPSTSKDTEHE